MMAFLREVSPRLADCELVCLARRPIEVARARQQHARYAAELAALGCRLHSLAPLDEHPDGVFVEDTAVLLPEVALITRPGAASRVAEVETVAAALESFLPVKRITAPATLDGGDVLRIARTLYVGASGRSNSEGIEQLRHALAPFGYSVRAVALKGCLHLKSACTFIAPQTLIVNPAWVDPKAFDARVVIPVGEGEAYGANTLTLGGISLVSAAFPRTRERLEKAGIRTRALDVSELEKAEAALTCMSLLLEEPAP